jgi:hypothetical protein
MMCRRGKIEGRHIGGIRVGRTSSVVEVAADVAADFEAAAGQPDPRDPRVMVRRWSEEPVKGKRPHGGPTREVPPDTPSRPAPKIYGPGAGKTKPRPAGGGLARPKRRTVR